MTYIKKLFKKLISWISLLFTKKSTLDKLKAAQKGYKKEKSRQAAEFTKAEKNKLTFLTLPRRTGFKKTPSIKHLKEQAYLNSLPQPDPQPKKKPSPELLKLRKERSQRRMFMVDLITERGLKLAKPRKPKAA